MEEQQTKFSGWAIVEMMGHRKEIGYVETQYFGTACLLRVDTPGLPEREFILTAPEHAQVAPSMHSWCPVGTKVKRAAIPARSCLVAPGSLYALNPCTEQAAHAAIEHSIARPLILVEMPAGIALPAPTSEDMDDSGLCLDCGRSENQCRCDGMG